jgi:hypothetical protein
MPFLAELVGIAHAFRVSGMYAIQVFVTRYLGMREFTHEVPGDGTTEAPSSLRGRPLRKRVEIGAGYIRRGMIMGLNPFKDHWKRFNQRTPRMVAQNIGPTEVSFPILKDRSQVHVDDVVGLDVAHWWGGKQIRCTRLGRSSARRTQIKKILGDRSSRPPD